MERENIPTIRRVVNDLHTVEYKIDDAIRECAAFIVTMVDAGREMRLSSTVGSAAYSGAAETLAQLTASRTAMVGMHNELSVVHAGLRVSKIRGHGALWKLAEEGLASTDVEGAKSAATQTLHAAA